MSDALVNGLAGAGGGIVAQLLTYPLQAVNTRQQTERRLRERKNSADVEKLADGTFVWLCKVITEEGWGGLYRGLGPSLVGSIASQGVYYYFYQVFRNIAEASAKRRNKRGLGDGMIGMTDSLVVAAMAGCLNVLLTNPIWVVVTRMQTAKQAEQRSAETLGNNLSNYSKHARGSSIHIIQELYREAGLIGFWKGVWPTLIMVCNPAIQFMIYEALLKQILRRRSVGRHGIKQVSALEVFIIGSIGKLGATLATYPLLVVKSRLQAKQVIGGEKSLQYSGTLDAILKMLKYEGLSGFYRGMSTKIVQSIAAAALLLMIKEELVKWTRIMTIRRKLAKA